MPTSYNGWSVIEPHEADTKTKVWKIPGASRHLRLRRGSAGFVLAHLALWFHETIEPIDEGEWDDWGYAYRATRGSTSWSNHASGTAMDLNAVKHPMGVKGTFAKAWMYTKIRARLVWMNRVIRWGGDYSYRKDEMHFEINKGRRATRRLARRLRRTRRGKRVLAAND